jgi:hypothetical protein
MKIKRSKENLGSGNGITVYESELFSVVHWNSVDSQQTTIECKFANFEILFDGKHEFYSDEMCLEQYKVQEIIAIIEEQKQISFEEGKEAKINEIKKCLNIY